MNPLEMGKIIAQIIVAIVDLLHIILNVELRDPAEESVKKEKLAEDAMGNAGLFNPIWKEFIPLLVRLLHELKVFKKKSNE